MTRRKYTRRGAISENLATPEGKIFRAMVAKGRNGSRSLSGVTRAQEALGLPSSWLRERFAGRIRIRPSDLEVLKRLIEEAQGQPFKSGPVLSPQPDRRENYEAVTYRRAVRRMCRECVGAESSEPDSDLECPDASCPLRPISPLRLSEKPIRIGETWE